MNQSIHNGFLTVTKFAARDKMLFSYCGNMGHRKTDVEAAVDEMFGKGAWQELEYKFSKVNGSADYLWTAEMNWKHFPFKNTFETLAQAKS